MGSIERESQPTFKRWQFAGSTPSSKGTWQDDHTFVVERLILGQGRPAERWTLTFDGEKLNVRAKLGDGDEITMDGEAGQ